MKTALLLSPHSDKQEKNLGFKPSLAKSKKKSGIQYDGDKHLVTIAPTGSGKGRCSIIPALLEYPGNVVVVDPKGENYAVTARRRREMGHKVVLLDPFNITGHPSDSFNLFDSIKLSKDDPYSECQLITSNLSGSGSMSSDRYWDDTASSLLAGIIAYLNHKHKDGSACVRQVVEFMFQDDLTYYIAVILDNEKDLPDFVRDSFIAHISIPSDRTRPCVDSTAHSYLNIFRSPLLIKSMEKSTFDLNDFIKGEPLDIYIVFPPDKMKSHQRVLVQWILTLIKATVSRRSIPEETTLFLLDETATLGTMDAMSNFLTLCRGYGVKMWLFFQDLQQIRQYYKDAYHTILNNAGVLQIFGIENHLNARELQEYTGIPAATFRTLPVNKQVLVVSGKDYIGADKYDYLNDEKFKKLFDDNPFYGKDGR